MRGAGRVTTITRNATFSDGTTPCKYSLTEGDDTITVAILDANGVEKIAFTADRREFLTDAVALLHRVGVDDLETLP